MEIFKLSNYIINNGLLSHKNTKYPVILYHGTNRCFTKHDTQRFRSELNEFYQGDWICYSPSEDVAWDYSKAARNQNIDTDQFFKELKQILIKPDTKRVGQATYDVAKAVYTYGFEKGWEVAEKNINKYYAKSEVPMREYFKELSKFEKIKNFDINDLCDILEYVEGSKSTTEPDLSEQVHLMLNARILALPHHASEYMKDLGFKDSIPEARIIASHFKCSSILETSDREEAKNAQEKYDLVIYSGEGTVSGEPEFLFASPKQVLMKYHVVERKVMKPSEDDVMAYKIEKECLTIKQILNKKELDVLTLC